MCYLVLSNVHECVYVDNHMLKTFFFFKCNFTVAIVLVLEVVSGACSNYSRIPLGKALKLHVMTYTTSH